MSSPAKAIAICALALTIGGVTLTAQSFEHQGRVLGTPDDPAMAPAFFTGTLGGGGAWTRIGEEAAETRDDGIIVSTGGGWGNILFTTNDPRMTGR